MARFAHLAFMNPFDPTRRERARAAAEILCIRPERLPGEELLDAQFHLLESVSAVAEKVGDDKVASPEDMAVSRRPR